MKRFNINYIETLSEEERQHLLMAAIPMLQDFPSKAGNEGRVFYVSNDVIVKKYFSKIDRQEVLCGAFDKYCKECDEFALKGYKIPRIYAWTMISRSDHSGAFDYYLLEERVPGRELFFSSILKMYEQEFKDHIDQKGYEEVIQNPELDPKFYEKAVKAYIHDFIDMNERIESMSDYDLENFLLGIYGMFGEGQYAIPDVHARNVLYYQGKLNLIDLYFEYDRAGYDALRATPVENLLLARMIALFNFNGDLKKYKTNDLDLRQINHDIDLNGVLCTEAMKKVIRAGKRICKFRPNEKWLQGFVARVEKILEKDQTAEILKEIDPKIL